MTWQRLAVSALVAAVLAGCSGAPLPLGQEAGTTPASSSSPGSDAFAPPADPDVTSSSTGSEEPGSDPSSGNVSSQSTTNSSADPEASQTGSSSASSTATSTTGSSTTGSSTTATSDPDAPSYWFALTLVNDGSEVPDQFLCYIDGANRCDEDQPLPAPGQSALYSFTTGTARPEILLVQSYYAATSPSASHSFASIGHQAELFVRTSSLFVSASCSSGCSLA